jgi:ATP-dependent Lhr-like helicase
VREEAWPQPETAEEVHDALLWMGFVTDREAIGWDGWLATLAAQRRVAHEVGRWRAVDGMTDPKGVLLGRLEALGPVEEGDSRIAIEGRDGALLLELEHEGAILRTRLGGRTVWCERRLLARIHRYTLERLRREIEPVSAAQFLQFLGCWQHADEGYRLDGPRGVAEVLNQLTGFEAPAPAWETHILPQRVRDYRREWLDELTLSGEFAWGRLWGGGASAIRVTPIGFVPREQMEEWLAMTETPSGDGVGGAAKDLLRALTARGPMFPQNLPKAAELVQAHVEMGLSELVARGFVTCDSFGALRQMIKPPSRRRASLRPVGRWSIFRASPPERPAEELHELAARQLLRRTGVVLRRTIERERLPVTWAALARVYRRMELRGEVRGGRFVGGFAGEQFALPEAVELLRRLRREGPREGVSVVPADPLNFRGILTPDEGVSRAARAAVLVTQG